MKSRKKYDDIYQRIQTDTETDLPESLQPEAIAALVKDTQQAKKKHCTARIISVSAAAVLVAVLAGVGGIRLFNHTPMVETPEVPQNTVSIDLNDTYLHSAADYREIEDYFVERQKAYTDNSVDLLDRIFSGGKKNYDIADGAVAESFGSAGMPENDSASAQNGGVSTGTGVADAATGTAASHGETNTQVENIDEADILKNDGDFLYLVRQSDGSCVEILDIRDRTKICLSAKIQAVAGKDGETVTVREIYVHKNTLVVLSAVTCGETVYGIARADACYAAETRAVADIYDITDRTAPLLLQSYGVDGELFASRMDGTTLVLLTDYNVPIYKDEADMKNACVPCYYKDGAKIRFPVGDVKIPDKTEDTAYLTVSLLDTKTPEAIPEVKAVLGGGQNVYCGTDTLLVARTETESAVSEVDGAVTYSIGNITTRLYAFDLLNGADYKGSVSVKGTVVNQFSMDIYNGYCRIATTAQDRSGCILTVLDGDLNPVGELSGIAKGEDIYAVRFLGDIAYLVTFYQTDPLFVVDVSNPEKPEIKGELKIPGFSNYLHPYSDGLLIGIGTDGDENGATGRVKISLYDVTDCQNPKEISKVVYDTSETTYSYSEAQFDHKAYLSFSDSGEFAVPICEIMGNKEKVYASVLTVENGALKITGTYTADGTGAGGWHNERIVRITYSGDTVYTLSDTAVTAFDRVSGEILCTYSTPQYEEAIAE
ncbi:MAG: beta-propeller domain-containing protein [Candidatus Fimenecus sp.]